MWVACHLTAITAAPMIWRLSRSRCANAMSSISAGRTDVEGALADDIEQVSGARFELLSARRIYGPYRPGDVQRLRCQQERIERRRAARRLAERGQHAARPQHLQRFQEGVATDGIEHGCHALPVREIAHASHEVLF